MKVVKNKSFKKGGSYMKKLVVILLTILMLFSFFQGALREKAVKGADDYKWVLMNTGLTSTSVVSFAIDPTNTQTIYAGTYDSGVFKSTNGGTSWSAINTGLTNLNVNSLVIDPTNTSTIYVGAHAGIHNDGVFKSTNGGTNWTNTGLTDTGVDSLVIDPTNTQTIYAGTYGSGVLKSTDGGTNWTNTGLTSSIVSRLAIDPTNTQTIYAGTSDGVYKSTDGGENWTKMNIESPHYIPSLAIDPTNTQVIYAGTSNGVFKSTDGGLSWTKTGLTNPSVECFAIDPTNSQIVYAGTWDSGVFKSTDGGTNWTDIGLIYVSSLAIDPTNTQTIYAGMVGGGVFKYIVQFTIITSTGPGGSISPSGTITVNSGESKTFTITPNTGYKISSVKVDGVSVSVVSSYIFNNVTSDHTISATFEKEITQTVIILQIGNSTFTVNGVSNTLDSPPVIKNNRTLLPIRAIVEALGGTIEWIPTTKSITIRLGSTTIGLQIGNSAAVVNGNVMNIDSDNPKVVPEIINSRTMLPLRFVTENLGCDVQWDGTTKTITITYQGR